jgi:hypothetical protein
MMDENTELVLKIIVMVCVVVLSMFLGGKVENQRILTKCLEHSATLPYRDAVEQCKEMVE